MARSTREQRRLATQCMVARLWSRSAASRKGITMRSRGANLRRASGERPSSGAADSAPAGAVQSSQTPLLADVAAPKDGRTPMQQRDTSQAPAGYSLVVLDCSSIVPLVVLYCCWVFSLMPIVGCPGGVPPASPAPGPISLDGPALASLQTRAHFVTQRAEFRRFRWWSQSGQGTTRESPTFIPEDFSFERRRSFTHSPL
jgi:hypothetical protein